jgi:hypothetical protein
MKRFFSLIIVLLFPYFVFADNWEVFRTNKTEYAIQSILQETDIINIQEGEYLIIVNRQNKKRQMAVIVIPGEKTVWQGIEEAKKLEQERKNIADRNKELLWEPTYLFLNYPDYIPFWIEE